MRTTLNPSRRYRNDILGWQADRLNLSPAKLVRMVVIKTGRPINAETIKRVLKGDNAGFDTVWAIADGLDIDRHSLTDFSLKERDFSRAVLNGRAERPGKQGRYL